MTELNKTYHRDPTFSGYVLVGTGFGGKSETNETFLAEGSHPRCLAGYTEIKVEKNLQIKNRKESVNSLHT